MYKQKEPVFVARKATKKDLRTLNKKFGLVKNFKETDIQNIIILEVNGAIEGIQVYDSKKHNFFEVTRSSLAKDLVLGKIKTEKSNKKLFTKFGTKDWRKFTAKEIQKELKQLLKKYS